MKSSKIGYLIKEGFKSIFTHGFMSFASVTIVVACLVIMGSFALIAVNINSLLNDLESQNEVIAYVEETLSENDARALQPQIEYIANIRSCEFVSKDQAMNEWISQRAQGEGDQSAYADLPAGVFRDRYIIYLEDISLMEQTKEELRGITGIAKVNGDLQVAEGFMAVRNVISAVSLVLVVVLVIVSVFIMSNTVKLATLSRRDEIAVMKIVGASNWFIRFPFVVEGVVLGILGGFIAYFLEWGLYNMVANRLMTGLIASLVAMIPFSAVGTVVLLVYLAVGLVVGIFGSSIAIRNYLEV